MPLAPTIAAALNAGLPSRRFGLYVNGLDVLLAPGSGGNRIGVPLESIELEEAGPGQVSSLKFAIEDPLGTVGLPADGIVSFVDLASGVPLFLGFLDRYGPAPEGIGRVISVSAVGIEALLDWIYVPDVISVPLTSVDGDVGAIVQQIVASGIGVGFPLRARVNIAAGVGAASSIAAGISGRESDGDVYAAGTVGPGTLRQCLDNLAALVAIAAIGGWRPAPPRVTIDYYGSLRWMGYATTGAAVSDWATLTVDSGTNTRRPANLEHGLELARFRQVYVKGGNAAGTGLYSDTGAPGPTATISDNKSTTEDYRNAISRAYLAINGAEAAGSFDLEHNTAQAAGTEYHAGGPLSLTDAQTGATGTYPIASIAKRWDAGGLLEVWHVEYGTTIRSAAALIRRLTRDQLS